MNEIGKLTITDDSGNTLVDLDIVPNGKISASVIAAALINKISKMNADIEILKDLVQDVRSDMQDHKEAFEHSEDSLQSLRTVVSALKQQ